MGHDGRGIATHKGKTQFIEGALAGETVKARFLSQKSKFDELKVVEVLFASDERVIEPCEHSQLCGGCSLQHMSTDAQIKYKQAVLQEQFKHFGNIEPEKWLPPLLSLTLAYRRKARFGIYYDKTQSKVILGFREKQHRNITDIQSCYVLDNRMACHLNDLRGLIESCAHPEIITHIEFAAGDKQIAVVVRHVKALQDEDFKKFIEFAKINVVELYLQPGGLDTVHKVWPESGLPRLCYQLLLPSTDDQLLKRGQRINKIEFLFHPKDFTQVNFELNQKMVVQALKCLDLQKTDKVLDLFCGLGNFTLPIAPYVNEVVGVEGSKAMVERGVENARHNDLSNTSFYEADLYSDFTNEKWANQKFDKILIDPPRSGALDVVKYLKRFKAKRIVYISCNPATLARDSGVLIDNGYTLSQAGVMDMFPHTSHVESIALFERKG